MKEKLICTYPPQYTGNLTAWTAALGQWIFQELTKILGKLNELEQRIEDLEP